MPNPYNYLDEDEKAQTARYWREQAHIAATKANWHKVNIYYNRARLFCVLRVEQVIY